MSVALIMCSMIAAWMATAIALLWGVLRVARGHQPHVQEELISLLK